MNLKSWESFFNQFPDYENVFEEYIESNNQVVIIGYSKCSNKMLDGKAIWLAEFDENKKIKKWQVFNDNIENRKSLKIA